MRDYDKLIRRIYNVQIFLIGWCVLWGSIAVFLTIESLIRHDYSETVIGLIAIGLNLLAIWVNWKALHAN